MKRPKLEPLPQVDATFTCAPFEDEMNVDLWPRWSSRWCDVNSVLKMDNPIFQMIYDHAPFVGGRKKVLVDVRNQYLEPGFRTSRYSNGKTGWHVDLPRDPETIFHMYQIGESRTEFKMADGSVVALPKNSYGTYTSGTEHRGVTIAVEEFRLLVRFAETDDSTGVEKRIRSRGITTFYPLIHTTDDETDSTIITEEEYYLRFEEKSHLFR